LSFNTWDRGGAHVSPLLGTCPPPSRELNLCREYHEKRGAGTAQSSYAVDATGTVTSTDLDWTNQFDGSRSVHVHYDHSLDIVNVNVSTVGTWEHPNTTWVIIPLKHGFVPPKPSPAPSPPPMSQCECFPCGSAVPQPESLAVCAPATAQCSATFKQGDWGCYTEATSMCDCKHTAPPTPSPPTPSPTILIAVVTASTLLVAFAAKVGWQRHKRRAGNRDTPLLHDHPLSPLPEASTSI
jgi:hypothetical protein